MSALERGGKRATLEAGGMRVTVALDDLEPLLGGVASARRWRRPVRTLRRRTRPDFASERARSVASSLDLRGARVDEALDALGRYLDDASLAGLEQVLIIHGLGTGALRDAVRSEAASHPLVKSVRAGRARRRRRRRLDHQRSDGSRERQGLRRLPRAWASWPPSGGWSLGHGGRNRTPQKTGGSGSGIGQSSLGAKMPPQLRPNG